MTRRRVVEVIGRAGWPATEIGEEALVVARLVGWAGPRRKEEGEGRAGQRGGKRAGSAVRASRPKVRNGGRKENNFLFIIQSLQIIFK
jgi:hypothetical protein